MKKQQESSNKLAIEFSDIEAAAKRINGIVHNTPIFTSEQLNTWLGHNIYFKAECLQKVGAFKARGGLNAVTAISAEQKPELIIANSSGNHAQAIAWAAKEKGIPCRIYMPETASTIKIQATRSYGAEVVTLANRKLVDETTFEHSQQPGVLWIPPYNHPLVMAGQGTAAAEALKELNSKGIEVDGVFAPCGGGGLVSGTYVATRELAPNAQVIGVEPLAGNDAAESRRQNKIIALNDSPNTLADGAKTLSVGDLTFEFIKQLDDFYEVDEEQICYWTQWLSHLLKLRIEPTSAMTMEGVKQWLRKQDQGNNIQKSVLVLLTGGNIDQSTLLKLYQKDYLLKEPGLKS